MRRFALIPVLIALAASPAGAQQPDAPFQAPAPGAFVVERIEVVGNTRTSDALAARRSGLAAGDAVDAGGILEAAEHLAESGLFSSVDVHTRPGSGPGRIVVVFEVAEAKPHIRLGVGYEDLTGWYLIPAQLNLDNLTGHGESFRLSSRLGYRTAALVASFEKVRWEDPRAFIAVEAFGGTEDRIYFSRGAEIVHRVARGGLGLRVGRPLPGPFALEGSLGARSADAEPDAEVYRDRHVEGVSQGDVVPYDSLATGVRDDVGKVELGEVGLALVVDSRRGRGLGRSGIWGRTRVSGAFSDSTHFSRAEWDLRGYVPIGGRTQLALRTRGGGVTSEAPFYERYYAGGLYTVRGYPSQSLTPPGGDLNLLTASAEVRGALIGSAERPRLAAIAFLDVAATWSSGRPEGVGGLGYGLRLRLPWVGYVGLDVGLPLDDTALGEAFHVNGSLGWTF